MGKTPSSHIIHSLGGEYYWIVRDSESIRLLKSPRSLSAYIYCYKISLDRASTLYHYIQLEKYLIKKLDNVAY